MGGRINSVRFGDGFVDLGAQWIHGTTGNVIWNMVRSQCLTDITPDSYSMGWFINSEGVQDGAYEKLFDICDEISNSDKCDSVAVQPYGTFFMNE